METGSMVKRAVKRTKKSQSEVKVPKPKKMAQTSSSRALVDPTTGGEVYLQPYDQYPEGFRYFAKLMYISGNLSMPGIASKLGMPVETVRTWSKRENWTLLKREVTRLANKEMVKASRKSMSNYMKDIDRGLNELLATLQERRLTVDKKIDSEAALMRYILEIWKVKLAIFRTLTYGVQGKAFTPHPGNLIFDGMEEKSSSHALTNTGVEDIMDDIPDYLKDSAKFILGMGVDDLDPAVIDAVAIHIDDEPDDDNFDLILEDE
jgi:hypothetical protein